MDMLKVRNELAHDYDSEIVKTYCNTIVKEYIASRSRIMIIVQYYERVIRRCTYFC